METLKVALSSLHANKLRSSLTILGIIVGIFSIIAISTIIEMLQTSAADKDSEILSKFKKCRISEPVVMKKELDCATGVILLWKSIWS